MTDDEMSAEPRNFVVSYVGRVGSSALIDTLKGVPRVKVPIFEELDRWYLKEHNLLEEYTFETIHEKIEALLVKDQINAAGQRQSVGFKWRVWGHPEPLAEVFHRNSVSVFNLVRNDLFELASSRYLSNIVYKDGVTHPQFALAREKDPSEKQRILQRYREVSLEAGLEEFFAICKKEIKDARKRAELLKALGQNGVKIYTIFYEDFAYKRFHFLNLMLSILRHPPVPAAPPTRFSKISSAYPSESFSNRNKILTSPRLPGLLQQWKDILYDPAFEIMYV